MVVRLTSTRPMSVDRWAHLSKVKRGRFYNSLISIFANGCLLLILTEFAIQCDANEVPKMVCGGREISVSCEGISGSRTKSFEVLALHFGNEDSVIVRRTSRSGRHRDKVVRRADCLIGDDGQFAVLVHFSDGPLGCGPCVIFDLCSLDGKRVAMFGEGGDF